MKLEKLLPTLSLFVGLITVFPAWSNAISDGMTLTGGLQTGWSSDLGQPHSQGIHPDAVGTYYIQDGITTPVTPTGYVFQNEGVTVSLQAKGLSGTLTSFATPTSDIEGSVYHFQANLTTPSVGYYGMGISADITDNLYISGASSSTLYYGMTLSDSSSGGANDYLYANVTDGTSFNSTVSSFSNDYFGKTNLKVWSGGSAVNSSNGSGFIGFEFNPISSNPSGSTLPGGTSTFDMWITFSSNPITTMPPLSSVPLPNAVWMFLTGFIGLLGFNRRKTIQE